MGYLEYYKLSDDPFRLTPDPEYFFPSEGHELGIESLDYAIENREGFCVITGEPGTGKTTLLNVFIKEWENKSEIALILTPRLMPEEFLAAVLEDLGVEIRAKNKNELIKQFRDFLLEKHRTGHNVIIIVDEAQNLPVETIEELRLLSNLETDKEKLLQIVLVGQLELDIILKSQALRQLNQRIVTKLKLQLLSEKETREYINFRLFRAGKTTLRYDDSSVKKIYQLTKGNPRLINIIAKRALMAAYLEESQVVSKGHVKKAAKSLKEAEDVSPGSRPFVFDKKVVSAVFTFLIVVSLLFWVVRFYNQDRVKRATANTKNTESIVESNTREITANNVESKKNITKRKEEKVTKNLMAVVSVNKANVRIKPGLDYKAVAVVSKGEKYNIEDSKEDRTGRKWYLIRLSDQLKGWISEYVVVILD